MILKKINKFIKIINMMKKLVFCKKELTLPKKKSILIFDENSSEKIINSEIIYKDYTILNTRYERINIIILFLSLIKFYKFKSYVYLNTYIEYCNPKIILTYIDTSARLIEIKKNFKNIIIIFIQNGYRQKRWNQSFNLFKKQDKIIDYYFVLNENWKNYVKNTFFKKTFTVGSLTNNNFQFSKIFRTTNKVQWVSQYRKNNNNKLEIVLLRYIKNFCNDFNLKLEIILANNSPNKDELNFYRKIIGYFSYNSDSYNSLSPEAILVGIDSTFLYEGFSRGYRTAFLTVRNTEKDFDDSFNFGWPFKYSKVGNFWTSELDEIIIFNIFKYLVNINYSEWKNEIAKYNSIMHYDPGNKLIKKYLSNITNEIL